MSEITIIEEFDGNMPTLIMCKGIPGSGKSHWAAEYQATDPLEIVVVTRDDIRDQYGCSGAGWSKEKEGFVIEEMKKRIRDGLRAGKTVVSADTNLKFHHEDMMRGIAKACKANFVIKFFDTPLELCIERDKQREGTRKVGEYNIRRYHETLLANGNTERTK